MRTYRKCLSEPSMWPMVLDGRKCTTIRPIPHGDGPNVGDRIQFFRWLGKPYRSKQENIGKAVEVTESREVVVAGDSFDNNYLIPWLNVVAHNDGFPDWETMAAWFATHHGLPMRGLYLRFKP